MTELIVIAILAVFVFVIGTLAAVLVVGISGPNLPRGRKTALAAVAGPGVLMALVSLLLIAEGEYEGIETAVGMGLLALIGIVMLGWPTAYLATRRLERVTRFDPSPFD